MEGSFESAIVAASDDRRRGNAMSEPVTTLDPRYGHPDAVATGWEETRKVLEAAQVSWITTVRDDGRPHVTPCTPVWLDEAIHVCTGASEQKALNLAGNSHVVVTTGCNDWAEGFDVVAEGAAEPVTDPGVLARLAEAWATKWDGNFQFVVGDGCLHHRGGGEEAATRVLVFSVVPSKVLVFTRGELAGHTTHRF
jgi:general stress protein 26